MGLNTERKNYTIGRGDLFFAQLKADGTLGGERPIGNTPELSLSVTSETLKHYSSSRGIRTQDREVPVQVDYAGQFTTDDINPKNLANLLLGSAAVVAIAAQVGVSETFTDVEPGLSYQLGTSAANPAGVQQVSNVVVEVGAAAKVLGTDYTVDEDLGRVTIIDGGTIVAGDDIDVTYDRAASSQEQVVSGATVVDGALRFIAHNPEGDDIDYFLPSVKLTPNGDYQIKSDNDWSKMQFKLAISADAAGVAVYANGRAYI